MIQIALLQPNLFAERLQFTLFLEERREFLTQHDVSFQFQFACDESLKEE